MDVCQGSKVRFVQAHDFMAAVLEDRTVLKNIFADCVRIGKLRATLEATRFSRKL